MLRLSGGRCIRGICSWQQPVHLVQFLESQVFYYVLFYCSKGHFEEITLRQLIFMMFFTLYHGFAESGVNNCAHIVGAIIGFVCGIIIFCQMKKNRAEGR